MHSASARGAIRRALSTPFASSLSNRRQSGRHPPDARMPYLPRAIEGKVHQLTAKSGAVKWPPHLNPLPQTLSIFCSRRLQPAL